jgi:hypothetical protein
MPGLYQGESPEHHGRLYQCESLEHLSRQYQGESPEHQSDCIKVTEYQVRLYQDESLEHRIRLVKVSQSPGHHARLYQGESPEHPSRQYQAESAEQTLSSLDNQGESPEHHSVSQSPELPVHVRLYEESPEHHNSRLYRVSHQSTKQTLSKKSTEHQVRLYCIKENYQSTKSKIIKVLFAQPLNFARVQSISLRPRLARQFSVASLCRKKSLSFSRIPNLQVDPGPQGFILVCKC